MNATRRAALGALPVLVASTALAGRHPDAELIGLCSQYNVLTRRIVALYEGPNAIVDDDERDEAIDPISDDQHDLLLRIGPIRATTMAGLLARIEMLVLENPQMLREPDPDDYRESQMLGALLRDGMGLKAWGGV